MIRNNNVPNRYFLDTFFNFETTGICILSPVNGEYITACPHDDAVNILRNAGDLVVLTVKHYKAATPFLQKQGTYIVL